MFTVTNLLYYIRYFVEFQNGVVLEMLGVGEKGTWQSQCRSVSLYDKFGEQDPGANHPEAGIWLLNAEWSGIY